MLKFQIPNSKTGAYEQSGEVLPERRNSVRRRQRKKLQELERKRAERLEEEARAEFEKNVRYTVSFGELTIAELESIWEIFEVTVIEGTNWVNRQLKKEGILTAAGVEVYAELRKKAGLE